MAGPRFLSFVQTSGLFVIFLIYLYPNIATCLVLDLSGNHSLPANTSNLNSGQSESFDTRKRIVCTARPDWVGTGYVKGCCHAALSRMYVTEVARHGDYMMEFTALGVTRHGPRSLPTPRKYGVGERTRIL